MDFADVASAYDRQLDRLNRFVQELKQKELFSPDISTAWIVQTIDLLIWRAWYAVDSGSVARNDAAQLAARADTAGVGLAFAVVAGAFLISSLLLAFLRLNPAVQNGKSRAAEVKDGGSIWSSIAEGFRFVRSDAAMFTLFLLIAAIELLRTGTGHSRHSGLGQYPAPPGRIGSRHYLLRLRRRRLARRRVSGGTADPQKAAGPLSRHHLRPQRHSDHALWLPDGDLACRRPW